MPRGRRGAAAGGAQRMDPIADVYERDRVAGLQRQVDALTAQLAAVHRQLPERHRSLSLDREGSEGDVEDENPFANVARPDLRAARHVPDSRRWEAGIKIEIPEFQGSLQPDELIDWINNVEEILEFKEVPADKRVPLVVTRFRGRASAWYQQIKTTRS